MTTDQNPSQQPEKQLPANFKTLIIICLGAPLVASIILTVAQMYPATYAIEWLTDEEGTFPLKAAILLNFFLALLPVLGVLLILNGVKWIFRRF